MTAMGEANVLYLRILLPALMSLITGLVIHSFIIGVNVNDWWKGRSVTPVDQILTSLSISRMCGHCAYTLHLFVLILFLSSFYMQVTLVSLDLVYCFFSYANVWLTSLLSIVLCLKISNLHTRLFLYLKRMILHRTGHFIVASIVPSSFSCLLPFLFAITKVTNGGTNNSTMDQVYIDCIDIDSFYNYTIVDIFPLLFYYTSSISLSTSLYHHTIKMKMSNNLTVNLETYYSVMRFLFFTFMYNTLYFVGHFVCDMYYYFYCMDIEWFYIVLEFLPVLHSSYLIYKTAKLRNKMSKALQKIIDFFIVKEK